LFSLPLANPREESVCTKKGVRIVSRSYPAFGSWRTSKLDKNNSPTPIELITYEAQADAGPR